MSEPPVVSNTIPDLPGDSEVPVVRSKRGGLLDNRPAILALLFFVTGVFGIPLLWMSGSFSQTEKIAWSIVVALYTLLLIGATVAICWWAYVEVSQLLNSM